MSSLKASQLLFLAPAAATQPYETHSALLLSQGRFEGCVTFEGSVCTVEQLRAGAANPWETAWLVWNYGDNDHFYYLALKTNGWELGKRDPVYEGGQRFLATGENVTFDVGEWARFAIRQDGDVISVSVDGKELVRFQDLERPYVSGRIGLYTEDARVVLDDVTGSLSDDFDDASQAALFDGARIGETWDVAFLGYGAGGVVDGRSPDLGRGELVPQTVAAAPAEDVAPIEIAFDLPGGGWLFS